MAGDCAAAFDRQGRAAGPGGLAFSKWQRYPSLTKLRRVLHGCRGYFVTAAIFSLAISLLYLAAPLYMLPVYDRAISSASQITLLMLTIALLGAFIALARPRHGACTRADPGASVGPSDGRPDHLRRYRPRRCGPRARSQMLRDFDTFRQFAAGDSPDGAHFKPTP